MILQVISLERLLAQSKNARGTPPSPVVSSGVACFSVKDIRRAKFSVTQLIQISFQDDSLTQMTIAQAWPLDAIDDGFVALDSATLATLGIVGSELPLNLSSLKSPRRRKDVKSPRTKKKPANLGDARNNGSENRGRTIHGEPHTPRSGNRGRRISFEEPVKGKAVKQVTVKAIRESGKVADVKCVEVATETENVELLNAEECRAMVHKVLVGRTLLKGMIIPMSLLGTQIELQVKKLVRVDRKSDDEEAQDAPGTYTISSELLIAKHDTTPSTLEAAEKSILEAVGGLNRQIEELLRLTRSAFRDATVNVSPEPTHVNGSKRVAKRPKGVLLHGPPGTGKTMLACAMAQECKVSLEVVCGPEILGNFSGEAVRGIEKVFERASRRKPCIVVLDEVDSLSPRRDAPDADNVQRKLTAALLALLDGHDDSNLDGVFVIGTTNRVDSIDPAMRRPGRFDREIEVTVPNAKGRIAILNSLSSKARETGRLNVSKEQLAKLANIAYGFVGADLAALWRESVNYAIQRDAGASVGYDDILKALKIVRPSALREVAVEIPSVKWDDIGGKSEAKQRLREAVEWPLTEEGAELFASIGVSPPKGILLFGPPGCSKTLLAKAVATESGANFVSVKGPELLSKWVGESEKAVRTIFRRARLAAPCVIFFDEIDALATSRSLTAGASAQARVVAQLLTEMDGIDTFQSSDPSTRVVVIAATNRPDLLDKALLRPGRIDVQIHIGLPDEVERLSILRVHTRKVPIAEDVVLEDLAMDKRTGGFSGAEVAALVREASLAAMEEDVVGASSVRKNHFDIGLSRVQPRTPVHVRAYFDGYLAKLTQRSLSIK